MKITYANPSHVHIDKSRLIYKDSQNNRKCRYVTKDRKVIQQLEVELRQHRPANLPA